MIVSNSDNIIEVTVLNADGTPFDLDDALTIKFCVYAKPNEIIQLFSSVTVVDANAGTFRVYLDRANVGKKKNQLFGEVKITVTNTNFASNIQVIKVQGIALKDDDELVYTEQSLID